MKLKTLTPKAQVREVLKQLPDDCTLEDVQSTLFLIDKINRSEESFVEHGGVPHNTVKKRLRKWLTK
jgi:hypothetical protein